jgi:phytoene dehydrogenase-like protein
MGACRILAQPRPRRPDAGVRLTAGARRFTLPPALDATVIGSGPNGLAAAITLARAGRSVRVYEAQDTIGGATRSAALTLPGFVHDLCATVHALAIASPFLRTLPLEAHGLTFAHPEAPFAHPLDDGTAVVLERSVKATADALGRDARAYRTLVGPFVEASENLMESLLGPPRFRHPVLMARFAVHAIRSAAALANGRFADARTRALLAGAAAHSMIPLDRLATSGFGLGLIVAAHAVGWPVARGGSQHLANAMASYLRSIGGAIETGVRVDSLEQLPPSRAVLCDVTPRQFLRIAGTRLPAGYRRRLERYRYGPGVFKMDWALDAPVPWRAPGCARAGTIHLGGSLEEIADAERAAWEGRVHDRPYVLLVQSSQFDRARAPDGRHTLWAYCHVPHASPEDMTDRIERQIERFAPGFRDTIAARHAMGPAELERRNANLVGGDISGGASDLRQLLTRPVASFTPYATPIDGVYLCSSSTPPGVGVHGMCGYFAAHAALKQTLRPTAGSLRS